MPRGSGEMGVAFAAEKYRKMENNMNSPNQFLRMIFIKKKMRAM